MLSFGLVVAALVAFAIAASAATGNSDISVTKTGPAGVASGGGSVTYSISVTDNGPDDATNVFMDDFLPAGEAFVSVAPASGCDQLPPVGGGGLVECITPTLTNGSTVTYTLSVQVASTLPDGTLVRNTASVQADQTDAVPSNNSSSTTLTVGTAQADLSITKTGPTTAQPGAEVVYKITVANNGPDPATNVTMTDALPAGETLKTFAFEPTSLFAACNLVGTISCNITSLPSGQSIIMDLTVQLSTALPDGSVITNTASTDSTTGAEVDPNPANNSSSSSLTVLFPRTDISVTKTGPATAKPGDVVVYKIAVGNNGPDDAKDVTMTDTLPAGETLKTFAFEPTSLFAACNLVGTINCAITVLPSGQSITMDVTVQLSNTLPDGSTVTNTATVAAGTNQVDPNASNNSSSTSLSVVFPRTDIAVTKTGPATAKPGDVITYKITVGNNGPADATNVSMLDALPAGETLKTFAFEPTSLFAACNLVGTINCDITVLPSGQSITMDVTVQLSSALLEGTVLSNRAVASPGSNQLDPDPTNNTSTSTLVVQSPDTDLAITAGISPAPVQATSASGAPVTFTVPTASDEDGPVVVGCSSAPGAIFPVGTTTVTCTATDADDTPPIAQTTLVVTVVDKDLALTGVPAPITMNATSPAGATVTYTPPTATDEETPPAVTCDHPSGSTFPIGTTTVTCSATDTDDTPSSASATFTVTVAGAASQLQDLLNFVQPLPPGTSFSDKVNSALSYLGANDTADACGVLNAIINQANAQSGKQLTTAQAAQIVAMAKQIEAVIPCP